MKKIAVIDDTATFRMFVKQVLELNHHKIDLYQDGEDFFQNPSKVVEYDLIIVDQNLPGMNGFTALENIRVNPQTQNIPVLIITGEPSKEAVDLAIRYRVNDFLSKPIDPGILMDRVERLLE